MTGTATLACGTGRGVWAYVRSRRYIFTIGGVIVCRCFVHFRIVVALAMSRLGAVPAQAGERTVPSPGPHDTLEVTSRHHAVDHPGGQVLE